MKTLVLGDSHVQRLREFVEAPPYDCVGRVQCSKGLEEDMMFLGTCGRIAHGIQRYDRETVHRISPQVVISMVVGKDFCQP